MKYKVGDRVRIKSLDWYNENKGNDGIVEFSTSVFVPGMSQFCGKVVTIEAVFDEGDDDVIYCMEEIGYDWTDEMFEGIEKEEMSLNIDDFQDDDEILDIIDEYVHRLKGNECQINLPNGYIFKDENGNIINATKIVLEKGNKYPKTYEECCKVLNTDDDSIIDISVPLHYNHLLISFTQLLICRDAYWRIAGEEMGLGKSWEPDWSDEHQKKFTIYTMENAVIRHFGCYIHCILAFPTEEMRDAFYENFKELIESCKELL